MGQGDWTKEEEMGWFSEEETTEVCSNPSLLDVVGTKFSGTDLTGTLANWMPVGIVRISLPF